MAVEAIGSVVIQKLKDILTEEESISNEKLILDQLEEIKTSLEAMERYFTHAEDVQRTHGNDKKWAEEYLRHVYYVEDTIESFALGIARQRKNLGVLMKIPLFLKNFTAFRKLTGKMQMIRVKIRKLNGRMPDRTGDSIVNSRGSLQSLSMSLGLQSDVHSVEIGIVQEEDHGQEFHSTPAASTDLEFRRERLLHLRSLSVLSDDSLYDQRLKQASHMYSDEGELGIIGFRTDVTVLLRSLKEVTRNRSSSIISIVGEMGSGKTTLARKVYRNREIKCCFNCFAWVTVPKEDNPIDLLLKLLKQVGSSMDEDGFISVEYLRARLSKCLKDKKYLIVLDGWSSQVWDRLKDAFPDNKNESKILVTCQEEVLGNTESIFLHRLKKMEEKDSWTLFRMAAGLKQDSKYLRKAILKVSNCLPLNIVLLGSLLASKSDQFQKIVERQASLETNEILSLCYNVVPVSLKLCLLYMVLFPREFDIPVRRLLRLWQAEGFVKRPEERDIFPEDEAHKYFDNLVKLSLIQVSKARSDGSPKKCRLLGVLHDYLTPRAEDISLFHIHWKPNSCGDEKTFGVRRLVEYADIKTCSLYPSQIRRLRSYLSFNVQKKDTPAKEVGNFLDHTLRNGKSLLRVLDLEGVYKPSLPENLGDFFHLRYLGLRWTFLDALPKSVGELYYLETLDIKHTNINTLPSSIWKLKHLRHLNLNQICLDMGRNLTGSIPKLLTLWGLSLDQESRVKGGLNRLHHLRELGITFRFNLSICEELMDWISELKDLQMLRLRSNDDKSRPSRLVLKPLQKLEKLSNLNLLGNLTSLPEIQDFPQGIKVLTLSVSGLQQDPMPILGQLPCLTVLRLLAHSYMRSNMTCTAGGFKKLRVLRLWKLENLETWDVEENTMEKLKKLNIRCCDKLRSIPKRLLRRPNFEELILTNMPRKFRKQVRYVRRRLNLHFSINAETLNDSSDQAHSL